jgi:hypothetical protein
MMSVPKLYVMRFSMKLELSFEHFSIKCPSGPNGHNIELNVLHAYSGLLYVGSIFDIILIVVLE